MPSLADIYSTIDSAKRRGMDFVQNPGTSLQQMLGNANDQARGFNQLTGQAVQEARQGGLGGPQVQQLANTMANAYNPVGMTSIKGLPTDYHAFGPLVNEAYEAYKLKSYSQSNNQLEGKDGFIKETI
jgi:hypothetical protein